MPDEVRNSSDVLEGIVDGTDRSDLLELSSYLSAGTVTSRQIVEAYRDRYFADLAHSEPINGFVEFFDDALITAGEADEIRRSGDKRPLLGVPIAVKDNIHIRGKALTCASHILSGYVAPYSATVIERLEDAGVVFLGRTNMDEFAMGSSCEYSAYGPSRNPMDRSRICGGSSGGSAAVVGAGHAPFALGSDTGGSVRLPASFCGVYGLKPTYGSLSRYGLVAFGSSLDQIGFLSRSPRDIAAVLSVTAGVDPNDDTSADVTFPSDLDEGDLEEGDLEGIRFGIPEQLVGGAVDPEVRNVFSEFVDWVRTRGATVETFSLPILDACIAIYYIIAPAEASSNLSRYDGVKFGLRASDSKDLEDMYERTRMIGFGAEVKRRILIGNYVLSSGYYDAYYKKAQAVRRLLRDELDRTFDEYDIILSPTSPTPAFRLGEKTSDPLAMYMTDICTTFANLASVPSLSIPAGATETGLPVGVQLTGARFAENLLLKIADRFYGRRSST